MPGCPSGVTEYTGPQRMDWGHADLRIHNVEIIFPWTPEIYIIHIQGFVVLLERLELARQHP